MNRNYNPPSHDPLPTTGIIIVDHGSRREESNRMLLDIVAEFRRSSGFNIIHAAHMELAEPTIADAFEACVNEGATRVIVHPYFLLPGRHWNSDIPNLTRAAAARHAGIQYLVTAPLGQHPLIQDVIRARISDCLAHAMKQSDGCELCRGDGEKCQFKLGGNLDQP